MKTLKEIAVKKLTTGELKELMQHYYYHFREFFPLLEARLSYWQMTKWCKTLSSSHPAVIRLSKKVHQHLFRGKQKNMISGVPKK